MSDTTNENIVERSKNAEYYFTELVVKSQTLSQHREIWLMAKTIQERMKELNRLIKLTQRQ